MGLFTYPAMQLQWPANEFPFDLTATHSYVRDWMYGKMVTYLS